MKYILEQKQWWSLFVLHCYRWRYQPKFDINRDREKLGYVESEDDDFWKFQIPIECYQICFSVGNNSINDSVHVFFIMSMCASSTHLKYGFHRAIDLKLLGKFQDQLPRRSLGSKMTLSSKAPISNHQCPTSPPLGTRVFLIHFFSS